MWGAHRDIGRHFRLLGRPETVVKALDALEAHGLIRRTTRRDPKGGHSSTLYTLLEVPPLVKEINNPSKRALPPLVKEIDTKEDTIEGRHNEGRRTGPKKKESDADRRREGYDWLFDR